MKFVCAANEYDTHGSIRVACPLRWSTVTHASGLPTREDCRRILSP